LFKRLTTLKLASEKPAKRQHDKGRDKMIYFTGDQHFGHANIIRHCNRPFSSIDEMDMHLVR